jgi:hypothetical protein
MAMAMAGHGRRAWVEATRLPYSDRQVSVSRHVSLPEFL